MLGNFLKWIVRAAADKPCPFGLDAIFFVLVTGSTSWIRSGAPGTQECCPRARKPWCRSGYAHVHAADGEINESYR